MKLPSWSCRLRRAGRHTALRMPGVPGVSRHFSGFPRGFGQAGRAGRTPRPSSPEAPYAENFSTHRTVLSPGKIIYFLQMGQPAGRENHYFFFLVQPLGISSPTHLLLPSSLPHIWPPDGPQGLQSSPIAKTVSMKPDPYSSSPGPSSAHHAHALLPSCSL